MLQATDRLKVLLNKTDMTDEEFEDSQFAVRFWYYLYGPVYMLRLFGMYKKKYNLI